ncbi:TPA: 30S ribosomal protein S8e [Candidatus Micrarchaeota archaeon]|nr:30S ribosomal protein S8e [Candidatus Micrarchaeota archaeon]HIH30900.1 30S ribosomal protein S8e [Candidatus Micrarchaeota archaeon]
MENYHGASGSTIKGSGGKRGRHSDKKLRYIGGIFTATKVAKEDVRIMKSKRGNALKIKLKAARFANVLTKDGMKRVAIRNVLETPDNRHHARQNIITKGAIIDTEAGKVKVTNRVGQDGVVNGRLL